MVAVALANSRPRFPLLEDEEVSRVLDDASAAAFENLAVRYRRPEIKVALQTMFVMGVAAGIELERGT
jgi:phage gp36-like protein